MTPNSSTRTPTREVRTVKRFDSSDSQIESRPKYVYQSIRKSELSPLLIQRKEELTDAKQFQMKEKNQFIVDKNI